MKDNVDDLFEDMRPDQKGLEELWSQIKDIISDDSSYNHEIVNKIDIEKLPWAESSVKSRILVVLRDNLEKEGIIDVKKEDGEGSSKRKVWVLNGDGEDES